MAHPVGRWSLSKVRSASQRPSAPTTGPAVPLPVGFLLLHFQAILLVHQHLARRMAPRQLLRSCHRFGFSTVHACGPTCSLRVDLPPSIRVRCHDVGLSLTLSSQRPPLSLQAFIAGDTPGAFSKSAYGLVQCLFGAAPLLPASRRFSFPRAGLSFTLRTI